ncbi:hypothetical protein SLEP1_g24386 [Rubroshorea leprosula]|uniref:Uncharacterized protein n=1 Tax=Rubroshorea leprosula TaxID=152421 RepID=A0AAV5JIN4_9ROSI|nr:hypothetical protein SLEP1_g24386 [Rubroshorea leprosula]
MGSRLHAREKETKSALLRSQLEWGEEKREARGERIAIYKETRGVLKIFLENVIRTDTASLRHGFYLYRMCRLGLGWGIYVIWGWIG